MKTIYELKLHEILWLNIGNIEVQKVHGGWIYRTYDDTTQRECLSSCFVPYLNDSIVIN